jgi:hypothetical protein
MPNSMNLEDKTFTIKVDSSEEFRDYFRILDHFIVLPTKWHHFSGYRKAYFWNLEC